MKDHGIEFYLGRCPLDPRFRCGGVPGAHGLKCIPCRSKKRNPTWTMVGTYLEDHPLANLFVCTDCYPNVWPREHRILQHRIVNDKPDDIPDHTLNQYDFLQLRMAKNREYVRAYAEKNKGNRSQETLNTIAYANAKRKQREYQDDDEWRDKQNTILRNACDVSKPYQDLANFI